ncbi:hypothetical protein JJL56_06960 [Azospirillum sp. YIM DDC1]|uniref:Uncharacterized protein n=1 Tax=Azospirillum aestuarii TaxID=2802052 RepID=A0ABS1HUU5_9PROT|nr:hypothetical protein [Azospirillum aestuarii]MBK4718603.1 hypothetical protein [Azospirillum aestuarii]TWA95223.1 hypothetical protein FBY14_101462 [Azospirillum brasilense]
MSTDESSERIATDIAVPLPDLSDLERQKAEIEAIQAQMTRLRARIDQRLDDQRPTIDLVPVHLDEPPPAVE